MAQHYSIAEFLVYLMCYSASVDMMRWVTMNQEEFNMSREYEESRTHGSPFEPDKILNEDSAHENKNPQFIQPGHHHQQVLVGFVGSVIPLSPPQVVSH